MAPGRGRNNLLANRALSEGKLPLWEYFLAAQRGSQADTDAHGWHRESAWKHTLWRPRKGTGLVLAPKAFGCGQIHRFVLSGRAERTFGSLAGFPPLQPFSTQFPTVVFVWKCPRGPYLRHGHSGCFRKPPMEHGSLGTEDENPTRTQRTGWPRE